MTITLTNSAVQAFAHCPKKYYYAYRKGIAYTEDVYQTALRVGNAIHAAIEARFRGESPKAIKAAAHKEISTFLLHNDPDEKVKAIIQRDKHDVQIMLDAYLERWKNRNLMPAIHPAWGKMLEVPIRAPLVGPSSFEATGFLRQGKCDGVVEYKGGWWLYEAKTTSDTIESRIKSLHQEPQIWVYLDMFDHIGIPLDGCIIDILKKPDRRMKKGEAESSESFWKRYVENHSEKYAKDPEKYLGWAEIPRNDDMIDKVRQQFLTVAGHIALDEASGSTYLDVKGPNCVYYGRPCEFKKLCWYGDTSGLRNKDDIHEELGKTFLTKELLEERMEKDNVQQDNPYRTFGRRSASSAQ